MELSSPSWRSALHSLRRRGRASRRRLRSRSESARNRRGRAGQRFGRTSLPDASNLAGTAALQLPASSACGSVSRSATTSCPIPIRRSRFSRRSPGTRGPSAQAASGTRSVRAVSACTRRTLCSPASRWWARATLPAHQASIRRRSLLRLPIALDCLRVASTRRLSRRVSPARLPGSGSSRLPGRRS